jgi:hypothetical protein
VDDASTAAALNFLVAADFLAVALRSLVFAAFLPADLSFRVRAAFFAAELRFVGMGNPLVTKLSRPSEDSRQPYNNNTLAQVPSRFLGR